MNIENAILNTLKNGGMTQNLKGKNANGGYAVAIKGYERVTTKENFRKELISFLLDNFLALTFNNRFVGTWFNNEDGKIYIDISEVYKSKEDAERVGRERRELAIFDLNTYQEIRL
jgi:predicted metalloprotease